MVEEIKAKFSGKWKLDRSEKFDELLTAIGVSEDVKKAAVAAKPEFEIQVEDDGTIVATSSSTVTKHVQRFQLNKEFEEVEHFTQKKIKNMPVYQDGKLRLMISFVEADNSPCPEYADREITDEGDLLMTIKINDVLTKRWYKRAQ